MANKIIHSELEWNEGRVKGFFGKDLLMLDNSSLKIVKVAPYATYPLHVHPDKTEYAYVLEGHPDMEIGPDHFSGGQGDFFIFPQQVQHSILNKTDKECLLLIGAIKAQY
jgi:quercetin dioxygenase-like cupin family protein